MLHFSLAVAPQLVLLPWPPTTSYAVSLSDTSRLLGLSSLDHSDEGWSSFQLGHGTLPTFVPGCPRLTAETTRPVAQPLPGPAYTERPPLPAPGLRRNLRKWQRFHQESFNEPTSYTHNYKRIRIDKNIFFP